MSLELFLDFLLSFVVLYVYHSDCHRTPAYACASSEAPLFAPVHREFVPTRYVSPEDYESTSYLVQPDDVWVADPMDTDEPDLAQLFALADAIVPMEADVAAELAELSAQVEAIVEEYEAKGLSSSVVSPVSVETKADRQAGYPRVETFSTVHRWESKEDDAEWDAVVLAKELAALDAEVDALVAADPVRAAEWGYIKGQYDRKPKLADLRLVAKGLGISPTKLKVAELTDEIVQALAVEGLTVFTMPNLANEILEVRDGKLVIVSDSFFD